MLVHRPPHFGHAAADVQQGVNRFRRRAHGGFGGEDAVSFGLDELSDEREIDRMLGHDGRPVAWFAYGHLWSGRFTTIGVGVLLTTTQ